MNKKLKAYLQLMRFPNTFTAMADVLAGYLIVNGLHIDWPNLLALILSTTCIYGAGCALNDIHDRETDARERRSRPIPSGMISIRDASLFTMGLYGTGLLCAFFAGWWSFGIAVVLVGLTLTYNLALKDMRIIGPLNMASCRALNLILGMSPVLGIAITAWMFPFLTLIYVFYLTALSQFEAGGRPGFQRWYFIISGILVIAVCIGIQFYQPHQIDGSIFMLICLLVIVPPLSMGLYMPKEHLIGRAVKYMIIGIPLLDAVYVAGLHGWIMGAPVALCIVPAIIFARFFYVT